MHLSPFVGAPPEPQQKCLNSWKLSTGNSTTSRPRETYSRWRQSVTVMVCAARCNVFVPAPSFGLTGSSFWHRLVAVTGIPDPQTDHAVIMVRFARDCIQKLSATLNQVSESLGEDTCTLKMRVGLHSGGGEWR